MKRLLLATAAVIALAVAVPIATAQYTTPPPATAPYTTPVPDEPTTPQGESLAQSPDTTTQPAPPPTTPDTSMPPPTTAETQTGVDTTTQAQAGATTDTYAATSTMGENVATPASLEQHARDAGMDHMPMSAQEVCMQREFTLTNSGTSLPREKEHQLIDAADRASVCEFQRVVIHSPNGRANEARQLLINSGVDAGMIEVQEADMQGLHVIMNFAGIATSSEQYAQLFSTQQYASYQPSTAAPGYAPTTPGAAPAPRTTAPAPDTTAPGTAPDTYQPGPSAPPVNEPSTTQPPATSTDQMEDVGGMSPTSGEPVVLPELYDT